MTASAATSRGAPGKIGIGSAIALTATLVAWAVLATPFAQSVEMTTYDLMRATARPSAPSRRVVLVNIDDDSVRRMEPLVGRWPWPRLAHASLINFLTRGGARLVGSNPKPVQVRVTAADVAAFKKEGGLPG